MSWPIAWWLSTRAESSPKARPLKSKRRPPDGVFAASALSIWQACRGFPACLKLAMIARRSRFTWPRPSRCCVSCSPAMHVSRAWKLPARDWKMHSWRSPATTTQPLNTRLAGATRKVITMASASTALAPSIAARPFTHTLRIYAKESKYEFLKNLRIPRYSLSVVLVPLMFYVLFGLVMGRQVIGGVNVATYLIASYGTFGVMGASLFGTAAGLAAERGLGWLQVKRASPMPPFAYFVAKLVMSMVFSASVVSLLFLLGVSFGGVRMPWMEAGKMLGVLVAGSLPFCCMGLAIGYFIGPNSA